jgi:hypothetical protein
MQRQAITTRYHGPTNHRCAKVSATAYAGKITLSWDNAAGNGGTPDNHRAAMLAFCERFQWEGQNYHPGGLPDGSTVWVHVTREQPAPDMLEAIRRADQQLDYGQYDTAQDILRAAISKAAGGAK